MEAAAIPTEKSSSVASELRIAVAHTFTWGIGGILAKAISFFMLPYYTHHLGPRDYGVLEILDLTMALLGMILAMGMQPGILRQYQHAQSERERHALLSSTLLFAGVAGAVLLSSGLLFIRPASALLIGKDVPWFYLYLSFTQIVFGFIGIIPYTYLRAKEAPRKLVTLDTIGTFLLLALTVFFISALHMSVLGMLLAAVICGTIKLAALLIWVRRDITSKFDFTGLRTLLVFGAPFILSNVTMYVLNFSDRFFLQRFGSLESVGIYAVAYKFGYMLNFLLIQPFNAMWQVRMYIVHRRTDHEQVFAHVFALYFALLAFAALGMALFSPEVMALAVDSRFHSGAHLVGLIALAYVFLGVGQFLQTGMFLTSRTGALATMSTFVTVLTLIANFVLIQHFEAFGAAWATVIGFLGLAIGSYYCSHRVFPLHLGVGRIGLGLVSGLGIYWISLEFAPASLLWAIAVKTALLGAFPVILWQIGFFSDEDLAMLGTAKRSVGYAGKNLIRPAWLRLAALGQTRN